MRTTTQPGRSGRKAAALGAALALSAALTAISTGSDGHSAKPANGGSSSNASSVLVPRVYP